MQGKVEECQAEACSLQPQANAAAKARAREITISFVAFALLNHPCYSPFPSLDSRVVCDEITFSSLATAFRSASPSAYSARAAVVTTAAARATTWMQWAAAERQQKVKKRQRKAEGKERQRKVAAKGSDSERSRKGSKRSSKGQVTSSRRLSSTQTFAGALQAAAEWTSPVYLNAVDGQGTAANVEGTAVKGDSERSG